MKYADDAMGGLETNSFVQLTYPGGRLRWSFGHPGVTGSEPGYLHEPDDAYLLANGNVSVADAQNCRILLISPRKRILHTFGDPAECAHEPPRRLGSPNGDTPLANGNIPLDAAANQVFENIGMHLGTPFVFLAQTQVVLPGGTPAPTGALTLTIKGQLSAKPNL